MITIYGCRTRRGDEDCSHGFELSASVAPNQRDWHSNYAIDLSSSSRTWAETGLAPARPRVVLAKLRRSVVARESARHSRHTRRRGLLARLLPVRRTAFVIDTDRTILKVVSNEVRASVHADHTLSFLENHEVADGSPQPTSERFTEPETTDEPNLVRPYTLTAGRIDSDVELALEAPVEAQSTTAKPPRWPRNDVRGQILTWCAHSTSVAEIAARLSFPLGATRFLVDDLVTQGYLRVRAPLGDSMSIDERRELITRTLVGLRAL
jgi:thioredoxin-dependent peroxiredoxin